MDGLFDASPWPESLLPWVLGTGLLSRRLDEVGVDVAGARPCARPTVEDTRDPPVAAEAESSELNAHSGRSSTQLFVESPNTSGTTRVTGSLIPTPGHTRCPMRRDCTRSVVVRLCHMGGKGTPATALLDRSDTPYTVHEYTHDPRATSFAAEAAAKLGVCPQRVYKTLVAEVDGTLVTAVLPTTGQLDLKQLANAGGGKRARMADNAAAERATGYVAGGISPLGQRKRLSVIVDHKVSAHATILCSGGRRGL